jgi:microcystin-dependent protein
MSQPFIGEIRMFGGNYAPNGWAFCDGRILAIADYDALFQLIGTTYGGDGQTTFNLPDLRGRIPLHQGSGFVIGQQAGSEAVTVTSNQLPQHTHSLVSNSAAGTTTTPANGNIVAGTSLNPYLIGAPNTTMGNQMIGATVGNQPHDNLMPYQCVSFIISLFGIFPSQN